MTLRRSSIAVLAALALSAFTAATASAGPWSLAPGEYYTELLGSFYSTGTYYDDNGDRMGAGGLYEQRGLTSYTELGWKKRTSMQMSLPTLSNTVRPESGTPASRAGFGDVSLGLRWALANKANAAAIQLGWSAPSGYNANLQPALGRGLQRLQASLQLGRPLGKNGFVQAGGGYAYDYLTIGARSTDLAERASKRSWEDHFTANAAVGLWFGRLLVAGQYQGEFSAQTGFPTETTTQLAGTRFAYRVDERLDAVAGSWHSPGGKNVLHVDQYYAGVAFKVTKLNRLQGFLGGDKRP